MQVEKEPLGRWPAGWVVALVVAVTLLRLVVAAAAGLTDDEAYYRLWSLTPAFGYLDHPPMVAWWVAAGRWLAGDTALGIRLLGPLALLVGSWPLWRAAGLLYGRRAAERTLLFFHVMPLIMVGTVVITPDTPAVLFWGLGLWCLAEYWRGRDARWFLLLGLFAGLGLLSKYTTAAFGAGILLWLAWHPAMRPAFRCWQLWAGGLLALLLFLPVVLWNAAHEQASFVMQLRRLVVWDRVEPRFLLELIGGQILLMGPLLAPFVWLGLRVSLGGGGWRDPRRSLVPLTALPFALALIIHALHELALAQWPAPLYSSFALLAGAGVGGLPQLGRRWRRLLAPLARLAAPVGLGFGLLLYAYVAIPGLPVVGRKEPTAQMRDWGPMAAEVLALARSEGAAWIATPNYGITGQLAFHLDGEIPVIQLGQRLRYAAAPPPDPALLAEPALFVGLQRRDNAPLVEPRFRSIELVAVLERRAGSLVLDAYEVLRVARPKGDPLGGP